jgi:hypothetical protein
LQVAIPDTKKRLGSGDALQELMVMLLAVAVAALCMIIITAFIRAAYHEKQHLEQHSMADKQKFARFHEQMTRPSNRPIPSI